MKRWLLMAAVCLAACGGDDDDDATTDGGSSRDGTTTMTGTVSGTNVGGAVISFPEVLAQTTGGPNNSVRFYFMDRAIGCGWQTVSCTDKTNFTKLRVEIAPPPPYTDTVSPGTYGNGARNFLTEAYLEKIAVPMFCGGGTQTLMDGFDGTLTITTRTATEITGSIDITMRERANPTNTHRMMGSFRAPICP